MPARECAPAGGTTPPPLPPPWGKCRVSPLPASPLGPALGPRSGALGTELTPVPAPSVGTEGFKDISTRPWGSPTSVRRKPSTTFPGVSVRVPSVSSRSEDWGGGGAPPASGRGGPAPHASTLPCAPERRTGTAEAATVAAPVRAPSMASPRGQGGKVSSVSARGSLPADASPTGPPHLSGPGGTPRFVFKLVITVCRARTSVRTSAWFRTSQSARTAPKRTVSSTVIKR